MYKAHKKFTLIANTMPKIPTSQKRDHIWT